MHLLDFMFESLALVVGGREEADPNHWICVSVLRLSSRFLTISLFQNEVVVATSPCRIWGNLMMNTWLFIQGSVWCTDPPLPE